MGLLKPETPEKLTHRFIVQNSEFSIESQSKNWKVWTWQQVVLLKVSGVWDPGMYPYHFSDFWDIFYECKRNWDQIYFIVDANDMPVQSEEFRLYVKTNWQHLIEREDFRLCIVEGKAMKRVIWGSIYQLLGIRNRVKMFKDHDRALTWLQCNQMALREGKQD